MVFSVQELRKGPWTPQEDELLIQYVRQSGEGRWSSVSKCSGLNRSGKSCRLRWVNYLRPGLKKGHLTPQEEGIIIELHALWGNKWSTIARYLPGRTDNEIKNYWRTHFKTRKPSGIKQEKRKILRQQKHQQQELATHHSKSTINESPQAAADDEKNSEIETEFAFPSFDNHRFLPVVNQETASDFVPFDCYLWGGLWNLDDGIDDRNGCSKTAFDHQNQANLGDYCYSFEGDYNVQNGDFIF